MWVCPDFNWHCLYLKREVHHLGSPYCCHLFHSANFGSWWASGWFAEAGVEMMSVLRVAKTLRESALEVLPSFMQEQFLQWPASSAVKFTTYM